MILFNKKSDSMECLENMRGYFLDDYIKKSDEDLVNIKFIPS